MPELRLATFNCENLMMRCDFARAGIKRARERLTEVDDAAVAAQVDSVFNVLSEDDRTLINTGGGSDYRHWVPALKQLRLDGSNISTLRDLGTGLGGTGTRSVAS